MTRQQTDQFLAREAGRAGNGDPHSLLVGDLVPFGAGHDVGMHLSNLLPRG